MNKEKFIEDRFEAKVNKHLLAKLQKVTEIRVLNNKGKVVLQFWKDKPQ